MATSHANCNPGIVLSVADPVHITLTNTVYDVIYENIKKKSETT